MDARVFSCNTVKSLLLVLIVVAMGIACGDTGSITSDPDGDFESGEIGEGCASDEECGDGKVCHGGQCLAPEESPCIDGGLCLYDSDCGEGRICNDLCACTGEDGDLDDEGGRDSDTEFLPDDCERGAQISAEVELDFGFVPYGTEALESLHITSLCADVPLNITHVEIVSTSTEFRFADENTWPQTLDSLNDVLKLDIIYQPQNAGVDEGEIIISSNDPDGVYHVSLVTHYKGTVDIDVSPASIDFRDVVVGDPASEKTLIVKNLPGEQQDNAVLRINDVYFESGSSVVFDISELELPFYLGQGQQTELTVACQPPSAGEFSDKLVFESNDPDEPSLSVELLCKGVEPILAVEVLDDQNRLDFGLQRVAVPVSVDLTLSNAGGGILTVQVPQLVAGLSDAFSIDTSAFNGAEQQLQAGENVILPVTFNGLTAGEYTGQISIDSDTNGAQTFIVNLLGRSVASAVGADPEQLDFGPLRVGQQYTLTLALVNEGELPVTLQSIGWFEPPAVFSLGVDDVLVDVVLAPGERHELHITFAPTQRATYQSRIHFTTDDAVMQAGDVIVTGVGIAPVIQVEEIGNPDYNGLLDFGEVRLDHPATRTLRLTNVGDAVLALASANLTVNTDDQEFSIDYLHDILLAPNQNVSLGVGYAPVGLPGQDQGQLKLFSDDPFTPEKVIGLSGLATDQRLIISPMPALEFRDTHFAAHSTETVRLFNGGYIGVLLVTDLLITEGDTVFRLEPLAQQLPFELYPESQNSLAVEVTFVPIATGTREPPPEDFSGMLRISANSYLGDYTDYPLLGSGIPCPDGYWDLDDNPEDCEYRCDLTNGGVEMCDNKDNDCNNIIDDGDNVTYNCNPPDNATAICPHGACDFVCNESYHRCGDLCYADDDPEHCGQGCIECQNDSFDCTYVVCEEGLCGQAIGEDYCLIDFACYDYRGENPENECQICLPFYNQTNWSNKENDATCDDDLFCTIDDSCQEGACTGGGERDCSEAITQAECQSPVCNEEEDACETTAANEGADCMLGEAGDGWHETGDAGPGCREMDDSVAERRDYACAEGTCEFSVLETLNCNSQDGYYGGGNDAGCGLDPESLQRDYYANAHGECVYTTEQCEVKTCDEIDICEDVCYGSTIHHFKDGYVVEDSADCIEIWGSIVQDCAMKDSIDSDESEYDYITPGTVTDYIGCAGGDCTTQQYLDTCQPGTTIINEYGANGVGVSGPNSYDCQSFESVFCVADRYRYRSEWTCSGSPGYCHDSGVDTLETDCGFDACEGTCGSMRNGCNYHERGCDDGSCLDDVHGADDAQNYCEICGLSWAIGGAVSVDDCCGDDEHEFAINCNDSSNNGSCGTDLKGCCSAASDCLDHEGQCADGGLCHVFGDGGLKSYCDAGVWGDPDEDSVYCAADGCGFDWMDNPAGTNNRCCGDDPGEDIEQVQGADRICCYNGTGLDSGTSEGSILCLDGWLYDCNGAADDHSGLAMDKQTCDAVGDWYCGSSDTWSPTRENNCACEDDLECGSGYCKPDYDGVGDWCADVDQCVHNGRAYVEDEYSVDCYNSGGRAVCRSGNWLEESCGTDTTCADHACSDGTCGVTLPGPETLCNAAFACVAGEGDGLYGVPGEARCQGYCDAAGHCDYAGNCQDCTTQDGWYNTGDSGPGCSDMQDLDGERRDYYCADIGCQYTVTATMSCNDQDGYYGGGNTPGCGIDAVSQRRDYYVTENGTCAYTTTNCETVSCDGQDVCASVCDGTSVVESRDYYVTENGTDCLSVDGALDQDCLELLSDDTDGSSTAYTDPGIVTDYDDCSGGACVASSYRDACLTDTVLLEYAADGTGFAGPFNYDCQTLETLFCDGDRYLKRNEWNCSGNPGRCGDSGFDSLETDCGVDTCLGSCGNGINGCGYHLRGCAADACFDTVLDVDSAQNVCEGCGLDWSIGGDVAAATCCGDDSGEHARGCFSSSNNGSCGADAEACCGTSDDCVDHDGLCTDSLSCHLFGSGGKLSYCEDGIWQDPDENEDYCTASGCSFVWMSGQIDINKCCGDDPGEDFEQQEAADRSCCYNSAELASNASQSSLICFDGLLYDCNGAADDDSGLSAHVAVCDNVGDFYCSNSDDWLDGLDNGCPCVDDEDCVSGFCKSNPEGTASWCASETQCVYLGGFYDDGEYSPDCFDSGSRARCNNGTWVEESCGDDSACTDYYCSGGACGATHFSSTVQCNSDWACSSGSGDNAYGATGGYLCRGYCDGAGNCDYASDCSDCNIQDGWHNTGDSGPGCGSLDDPMGELRDYYCSSGACGYGVTDTLDCDDLDGYYGGGDTAGCGDDPSATQRDYYVSSGGSCVYTTQSCATLDCDGQDACSGSCNGSIVASYQDFYVAYNSDTCAYSLGGDGEDCATKASIDSDGAANAFTIGGSVTDYVGCAGGACTSQSFADVCESATTLREYGASGSGTSSQVADCENNETTFCQDNRYRYRNEWECKGAPAYCGDSGYDTLVQDCGTGTCLGVCGSGPDGCTYHERGCSGTDCYDLIRPGDDGQSYCTGCGLSWNLGGEVAASTCCGDDAGENSRTCSDDSANGDCGVDMLACCGAASDCVDHNGACADSGSCHGFGSAALKSYCSNGTWQDPDESSTYCAATGCGYAWLANVGSGNRCCGDDGAEDIEQTAGTARSCCYNGLQLASGATSGSVQCYNGQLYDCNGAANDDSDLSTHSSTCGKVGSLYCTSANTWASKLENGCGCLTGSNCQSSYCKNDYDGSGAWCANSSQCAHNAAIYSSGQKAPDCVNAGAERLCANGSWSSQSCGSDTTCSDYACSSGSCGVTHYNNSTQCDTTYRCSSGTGNNHYAVGGDYLCRGYCDGAGACDYADSCDNCGDNFSHASGTCSSNSCTMGSCLTGYADCAGGTADGCEVNLNDGGGNCSDGASLGNLCGDKYKGFLCPSSCEHKSEQDRSGYGERWFKIYIEECSICISDVKIRVRLQSPAGMDYDLHLYEPCGTERASSTNGAGQLDEVSKTESESYFGGEDGKWYWIEVRYISGSSCDNWTLQVHGGNCG